MSKILEGTNCPLGYWRCSGKDKKLDTLLPGWRSMLDDPEKYFGTQLQRAILTNNQKHEVVYVQESVWVDEKELKRTMFLRAVLHPPVTPIPSRADNKNVRIEIGTESGFPHHGYDTGHIIPHAIGGPADASWNFFPQHPTFNRVKHWAVDEKVIRNYLNKGNTLTQTFIFNHGGGGIGGSSSSAAPTGFLVHCDAILHDDPRVVQFLKELPDDRKILFHSDGYYDNPNPRDSSYTCPFPLIDARK